MRAIEWRRKQTIASRIRPFIPGMASRARCDAPGWRVLAIPRRRMLSGCTPVLAPQEISRKGLSDRFVSPTQRHTTVAYDPAGDSLELEEEDSKEPEGPRETDPATLEFVKRTGSFILVLVAPLPVFQISPTRAQAATLGVAEEHFIENFIDHVKHSSIPRDRRVLHLVLHSHGGAESTSFVISKSLRKNFGRVVTYVPHVAASGATVIALPSDEIVMGEISRSPRSMYRSIPLPGADPRSRRFEASRR